MVKKNKKNNIRKKKKGLPAVFWPITVLLLGRDGPTPVQ
jgi:hypothetical protein